MRLFLFVGLSSLLSLSEAAETPTNQPADRQPKKLLILGDSLSEGYGVARDASYASLLEKKLQQNKKNWKVINASISGSTTASAVGRLKWQLKNKPDLLILALGANDGLRGTAVTETQKNLDQALELAKKEKLKTILFGMKMPPNYGEKYTKDFEQMYVELAKRHQVKLVPFFLEGVAGLPEMNQADGIHPNEKGHQKLSENVYRGIEAEL